MEFFTDELYHIYNRGNNKQKVFFKPANYVFFLKKVRNFLMPQCDILAYCLMPNHFHLLINADNRTIGTRLIANQQKNVLSEAVRILLSSCTLAINKQNETTGSLFQQNTKAKCLAKGSNNYGYICMNYIHQNPMKAGLVKRMEDWEYSSFNDYCVNRSETMCNKELARQLLDLNFDTFYDDSYRLINDLDVENLF